MANKKYEYKISNVSDINALTSAIKKHNGVEDCYVKNSTLYYILNDHADEYEIMVDANELCTKYGGELIIGEETYYEELGEGSAFFQEEEKDEKLAYSTVNEQNEPQNEGQTELEEEQSEETSEPSLNKVDNNLEDDFDYQDRLVVKKQTLKKDAFIRIGELFVSTILLIVCYALSGGQTQAMSPSMFVGVLAFAIGGYEIFYSAIGDIVHKKFLSENIIMGLACLLGAFLGYLVETTALALVFGITKEIEVYASGVSQNKLEEIFYTGSVAIKTESGETKKLADIAVNDVLSLSELDIIPCDGIANCDATLDCYRSLGIPEAQVKAGDKVYAGSIVLSENLNMTVEKSNAESQLVLKKNAFEEKLTAYTVVDKKLKYLNVALVFISLLLAFIPPIFGKQGYLLNLQVWGARAIALLSISMLAYAFYLAANCIKNALIALKYTEIEVNNISTFNKLAKANAFKFKASTLTENGSMKADTHGVMNELLAAGVKNVETEFDLELDEEVEAKLDFVQNNVSNKREIVVGKDIMLGSSGDIAIARGEISFVPLSYKIAKLATKRKKLVITLKLLFFVATIAALLFVPFKLINPIYFGVINGAITALFALFSLSILKNRG